MTRSRWILVVALAALFAGLGLLRQWITAAPPEGPPVEFSVTKGESFHEIANRLEEERLVVSAWRTRALARWKGMDRQIRAGTYRLERGRPTLEILAALSEGKVLLRRITVKEGARIDQIALVVRDSLKIPPQEFALAAGDSSRRGRLHARSQGLEGYLFPDTYFFPDGVSAGDVLDAMLARFEEEWETLSGKLPDGFDRHDVVTLASVVEAETPLSKEKPRVAAVYLNRIRRGWKLQADPTVRYGLAEWDSHLYYKHLHIDTPYNTYIHAGLPPSPIGSPSRESIAAVLDPMPNCEDLFFVASGDGGHVFSRTNQEHDRARRARAAPSG